MSRKIKISENLLEFTDEFETIIEKTVTKFGSGAKLDCPKAHLGKKTYIIIRKS